MTSDWTTIRAADFIDFNPRLSIKKGTVATKIAMDKLKPFTKRIPETGENGVFRWLKVQQRRYNYGAYYALSRKRKDCFCRCS